MPNPESVGLALPRSAVMRQPDDEEDENEMESKGDPEFQLLLRESSESEEDAL